MEEIIQDGEDFASTKNLGVVRHGTTPKPLTAFNLFLKTVLIRSHRQICHVSTVT